MFIFCLFFFFFLPFFFLFVFSFLHASFFALCSFFVPSFLSFFLSPYSSLSPVLHGLFRGKLSFTPIFTERHSRRGMPPYLLDTATGPFQQSLYGWAITLPAACWELTAPASSVPSLSQRNYQLCTIPGLGKVKFLFRHTVLQPLLSLKLLVNSSTTPAITLKYILKHCKLSNSHFCHAFIEVTLKKKKNFLSLSFNNFFKSFKSLIS